MNLNRQICPGCGALEPKNVSTSPPDFCCANCQWEADGGLPTPAEIAQRPENWHNVNNVALASFLNTLLAPDPEPQVQVVSNAVYLQRLQNEFNEMKRTNRLYCLRLLRRAKLRRSILRYCLDSAEHRAVNILTSYGLAERGAAFSENDQFSVNDHRGPTHGYYCLTVLGRDFLNYMATHPMPAPATE